MYYRNIRGVVLVISMEDSAKSVTEQLKGIDYWMEELNNSSEITEKLACIILGNKADLMKGDSSYSDEKIRQWCKK